MIIRMITPWVCQTDVQKEFHNILHPNQQRSHRTSQRKRRTDRNRKEPKDVGSDKFDKKPSVARVTFGNMTALNRLSSHGGTFQIKSVRKVRCFFLGVCGWNREKIVHSWFQGCASHEFKTGRTGANEVIRPICYGSTQLIAHILKCPSKHNC